MQARCDTKILVLAEYACRDTYHQEIIRDDIRRKPSISQLKKCVFTFYNNRGTFAYE